jgi:C1A family cysteine protease
MDSGWGGHLLDNADDRDKGLADLKLHSAYVSAEPSVYIQYGPTGKARVDLRQFCLPPRDQGRLRACVGFATTALVEFLLKKRGDATVERLSPFFVWSVARKFEFSSDKNSGVRTRNGMRILHDVGCALERTDPYEPVAFVPRPDAQDLHKVVALLDEGAARQPTLEAVATAAAHRIDGYYALKTLAEIKECLEHGFGVIVSFPVYASAAQLAIRDGVVPQWRPGEKSIESHTMFAVGYRDDDDGYLICKGSQGVNGGKDGGYFDLPYTYFEQTDPGWNAWTAVALVRPDE